MSKSNDAMARALALRAFAEGFAAGADPDRAKRRRVSGQANEEHWRRGYNEGREAAKAAEERFKDEQRSLGLAYRVAPAAVESIECGSCGGLGHIGDDGPTADRRERVCLDCSGEGRRLGFAEAK